MASSTQYKKKLLSLSLNCFLRLYSDLAETHNIPNTEEGNIISWKSWDFFQSQSDHCNSSYAIEFFVPVRNHDIPG